MTPRPGPARHGRRPRARRRFGQHFLAPGWARKVAEAIAPAPGDVFVEIGPGTGALTRPLAESGAPIAAVEIDRDLARDLASGAPGNVTVVTGDALETDLAALAAGLRPQGPPGGAAPAIRVRVAGNLPFNIASPILFRLIDLAAGGDRLHDATLMVQREVADRLLARPGTRAWGVLGILVQAHVTPARLFDLPPSAFAPRPKVTSTLVRLAFGPPRVRLPDEALFAALVRGLFSQRRKTLLNAMRRFAPDAELALARSGLDPTRRPGTLTLSELADLAGRIAVLRRPPVL